MGVTGSSRVIKLKLNTNKSNDAKRKVSGSKIQNRCQDSGFDLKQSDSINDIHIHETSPSKKANDVLHSSSSGQDSST